MTLPLPTRRFLPAALILAGAGLAAACTTASTASTASTAEATAPFACEITVTESGNRTRFEGRLQAAEPVSGSYSLSLAGRGTNIRQGGGFAARAGETVTLGQSMLSGPAASYQTELTITVGGQTYSCRSMETET